MWKSQLLSTVKPLISPFCITQIEPEDGPVNSGFNMLEKQPSPPKKLAPKTFLKRPWTIPFSGKKFSAKNDKRLAQYAQKKVLAVCNLPSWRDVQTPARGDLPDPPPPPFLLEWQWVVQSLLRELQVWVFEGLGCGWLILADCIIRTRLDSSSSRSAVCKSRNQPKPNLNRERKSYYKKKPGQEGGSPAKDQDFFSGGRREGEKRERNEGESIIPSRSLQSLNTKLLTDETQNRCKIIAFV